MGTKETTADAVVLKVIRAATPRRLSRRGVAFR